jgi:hypothetical protein
MKGFLIMFYHERLSCGYGFVSRDELTLFRWYTMNRKLANLNQSGMGGRTNQKVIVIAFS